jgi:hypothetical protein
MTTPTLAQALNRAKTAVDPVYGTGHDGEIRRAVEPLIGNELGQRAVIAAFGDTPVTVVKPAGWSGIRGDDQPSVTISTDEVDTLMDFRDLARDILESFKEGKDGHWRAHVSAGQYAEWKNAAGGSGG